MIGPVQDAFKTQLTLKMIQVLCVRDAAEICLAQPDSEVPKDESVRII